MPLMKMTNETHRTDLERGEIGDKEPSNATNYEEFQFVWVGLGLSSMRNVHIH